MFLKGTRRNEVPTYVLTLPLGEGAPIFKVEKVTVPHFEKKVELTASPVKEAMTVAESDLSGYTSAPEDVSFD